MNLLSGLEKFGLEQIDTEHLFEEEKKAEEEEEKALKEETAEHQETEFLFLKNVNCPVCNHDFRTRTVKTGRVKRMGSDFDLRPRFAHIDTNKYDVSSCPRCGYTAVNRYFVHLIPGQIKLLEQVVRSKFKPNFAPSEELVPYTYEEAIERYKLALYCTIVKKGHASEKAYECLKISWLYRGLLEEFANSVSDDKNIVSEAKEQEMLYYREAYEGFLKAIATENFPMCGIEEHTMSILLANMAFRLGKNEVASKLVSRVLTSHSANRSVKDRALNLKERIIQRLSES